MDFLALAKTIAPLAPIAGSIIGGFIPVPGASLVGQKLGEFIAHEFGVPATNQAISDAVATAGEETARAKINAALERARAEIQGFTEIEKAHAELLAKTVLGTNQTMQVELAHEHWFFTGWRPAIGWVFVFEAVSFGLMLTVAAGAAAFFNNPRPLEILGNAWPIFAVYFGTLGLMVGVYIPSRSAEKKAAIETGAPMPNAKPIEVPGKGLAKLLGKPAAKPQAPGRIATNLDGE